MLELFMQPEVWVIFATLFALEVVLGVDNVVFISVLCERLPSHQRKLARNLGIGLAVLARIGLVFSITWIMQLTQPLFSVADHAVTGRDMIMILGGAFLLAKSLKELWSWLTHNETDHSTHVRTGLAVVLLQIVAVDAVFSMDSVITAVGLTSEVPLMVAAIITSALVMVMTAEKINNLVTRYPGFKTLALLFLVLLGGLLMAEGFAIHINKGYVYFAMAFGLVLELCHIQLKNKQRRTIQRIRPMHQPTVIYGAQ
ncbi:TerC family protein [Vibrio parahaemolyticus]|uniref:TerC family protein n=1 Tax=Vibrio parahaemolyticus TaxID=670 RepID=UPI0008137C62|nr:TerC family protein [Vibrio parahaemolyticus]EGQ9459026.1 TerC family protein [Vibrio parahaemolyticus]EJE4691078.1 TerC family protein [Vibrio parahaemolyticus]EJK2426482.1 TerC family protein [Vibrio parahaemolyticus]OCP73833.1 membrane protein [Vibrio parahaemolyticus]